jgi:hypothetical protein
MLRIAGKRAFRTIAVMRVVVADTGLIASTRCSAHFLASVDAVRAVYARFKRNWNAGDSMGGVVFFAYP